MLLLIASNGLLGSQRLGHASKGGWVDDTKFHNDGDLLLIYQVAGDLQELQEKSVEIFTAETLAPHRYARHG